MYKKYFSFRERPFKLVPNPEYYYVSRSHEEAMAHLSYAISEGDGFVEITGEVGTGKTTLCRVFLENIDARTEVAYIFNPRLGPKQLLKTIADELGIHCRSDDIKDLIDALNLYLIKMKKKERRVVLLVDEAQNLSRNVLEQLRLLSNLETNRSKLLQIILVGQPELGDLLDSYDLRQLAQRITLSCQLSPLTLREAREYIEHRILIASYKTQVPFSGSAIRRIYRYSKGVPRLINIVCDRSLLTAFSRNRKKITGGIVRAAIRELDSGRTAARRRKRGIKLPLAIMAIFSVSVLMFWFYKQGTAGTQQLVQRFIGRVHLSNPLQDKLKEGAGQHVQELAAPKSSQNILQGSEFEPLSDFLDDMDVKSARLFAMEAVLELWINDVNFDPSLHNEPLDDDFFQKAAEQNGFSMLRTECDTQLLISLNLPAIVAIQRPRGVSPGFLTLQAIDDHEVTLGRKGKNAVITVPMHVLNASCSGAVYIPWRNQMGEDDLIPGGQPDNSIMMLKQHLREIGYTQVGVGPFYDDQTEWAVQDLQEKYGLAPDGIVGPLTKIMILNENPNSQIPHIRQQLAKR